MSIPQNIPSSRKSLGELKIRSRMLHKAVRQGSVAAEKLCRVKGADPEIPIQHKDCLRAVAQQAGFKSWQHASHILSGEAGTGENMGDLWYDPGCSGFLNIWCRDYAEAEDALARHPDCFLLPYRTQFVVANRQYMQALGLFVTDGAETAGDCRDLVALYGSAEWDNLTFLRLQAAMGPASV